MNEAVPDDEALARNVVTRLAQARAELFSRMEQAGLTREGGWRIREDLRHTIEGTVWTFTPIHLHRAPVEMSTTVVVDGSGNVIESSPEPDE